MRKGKGDLEPTRFKGGLPPVQLKDMMLNTDSGPGEQDRGLHKAEHGLCEQRMRERSDQKHISLILIFS